MKVIVTNTFYNDLARIRQKKAIDDALFYIDFCEKVMFADQIPGFKYLRQYKDKGRIEIAPFRIGVEVIGDTIIFKRILPRDDIYKQFP
jgi:mRNA interferase RelE/StbE